MAQTVKNLPAMWETWFQSLLWEESLEEGMETHSHSHGEAWQATVHEVAESDTTERLRTHTVFMAHSVRGCINIIFHSYQDTSAQKAL